MFHRGDDGDELKEAQWPEVPTITRTIDDGQDLEEPKHHEGVNKFENWWLASGYALVTAEHLYMFAEEMATLKCKGIIMVYPTILMP